MMRRKDLSGAKVWIVACLLISWDMLSRFADTKISGAFKPVTVLAGQLMSLDPGS